METTIPVQPPDAASDNKQTRWSWSGSGRSLWVGGVAALALVVGLTGPMLKNRLKERRTLQKLVQKVFGR